MRSIDADKTIDNINEWLDTVGYAVIGKGLSYYAELIGCIDESPTIEAEPVRRGHWDADADGYADGELVYDHWFCSECGWDDSGFLEEKPNYKYCPNCGARMEDNK